MYLPVIVATAAWLKVPFGGILHSCVITNRDAANTIEMVFEKPALLRGHEIQAQGSFIVNHWDTSKELTGKIHTVNVWLRSPAAAACDVDITYTTKSDK